MTTRDLASALTGGDVAQAPTVLGKTLRGMLLGLVGRHLGQARYRPEQHYMRGPGPKARAKAELAARADEP